MHVRCVRTNSRRSEGSISRSVGAVNGSVASGNSMSRSFLYLIRGRRGDAGCPSHNGYSVVEIAPAVKSGNTGAVTTARHRVIPKDIEARRSPGRPPVPVDRIVD